MAHLYHPLCKIDVATFVLLKFDHGFNRVLPSDFLHFLIELLYGFRVSVIPTIRCYVSACFTSSLILWAWDCLSCVSMRVRSASKPTARTGTILQRYTFRIDDRRTTDI